MWNFSWRRPPALPERLKWIYGDEPALMEWSVRARHYNVFSVSVMYGMLCLVLLAYVYFTLRGRDETIVSQMKFWMPVYIVICAIAANGLLGTVSSAYRVTLSGIEYCIWKNVSVWGVLAVKWLAIFTGVLALFLVVIDPRYALGALVGAGGIGLRYYSMVNSESWKNLHSEYNHHFFNWSDVIAATIASNRNLIELSVDKVVEQSQERITGGVYVFFQRDERAHMVSVITQLLPSNIACTTGKVVSFR